MRCLGFVAALCGASLLAGCSGSFSGINQTANTESAPGARLTGKVHGGQNPISGAHVYLFAAASGAGGAGQAAYGGAGIAASASNASVSLLNSTDTGYSDSLGAYVLSGSDGSFSISGDYTCTAGQQVYVYALGGDPGLGTGVNPAAGLMAALGTCPAGGNFMSGTSPITSVMVNEVSTVAAAYAMAGFATDALHVGSSGTTLAQTGIANAFANAANLANLPSGVALATTPAGNGTVPQAEINTLANILAACVNSNGTASACSTLFANAESGGTTGTVATDTATAAINIAHNPGAGVAALYGLASGTPPFTGGLTAQPNDWTLPLKVTGGGLSIAHGIAIDGLGNAWVVSNDTRATNVSEFSSSGAAVSPTGGYTGGGLANPMQVAIDTSNNVWVMNDAANSGGVTKFSYSGSVLLNLNATQFGNGMLLSCIAGSPSGISIDGTGNIWLAGGYAGPCTLKLSNTGSILSGSNGYTGGGLSSPVGVAVDGSGNAWVASLGGSASQFSSTGTALSGPAGYYVGNGIWDFNSIAVDASGDAWSAVGNSNVLVKLSNTGATLSGASGYAGGGLYSPGQIAIDGTGNVWVADGGSLTSAPDAVGDVSEFSGAGLPISAATGYVGIGADISGNPGPCITRRVWLSTGRGMFG